ncbi:TetR/AcrR family transcriptional regulator [Streptacidiphilus sp. P02-A3a]|nr:TetR/AcrR family transcriptional regulator [Streptacidiphilus sp. P02-A3a]
MWLRPERSGRGPAPGFDRDRLAAAGVALADRDGLAAVTMRAVAQALGAGPASLYRYVATREELLELMIDQAVGEIRCPAPGGGGRPDDLLALARQKRELYLRHPWLLDATATRSPLGPHALAQLEYALAALAGLPVSARTKLEALAMLDAVVAALSRTEVTQRRAGRTLPQWQQAQQEYLARALGSGRHPHLAAALDGGTGAARESAELLFDRLVTRVLAGLLREQP